MRRHISAILAAQRKDRIISPDLRSAHVVFGKGISIRIWGEILLDREAGRISRILRHQSRIATRNITAIGTLALSAIQADRSSDITLVQRNSGVVMGEVGSAYHDSSRFLAVGLGPDFATSATTETSRSSFYVDTPTPGLYGLIAVETGIRETCALLIRTPNPGIHARIFRRRC